MNFDIHEYKRVLRQSIYRQWQQIDIASNPLDWVWMYSALLSDGNSESLVNKENNSKLITWAESSFSIQPKNLGALGIVCTLLEQLEPAKVIELTAKLINSTYQLLEKQIAKFSPLNDPIIFYGIVLAGKGNFLEQHRSSLETYCLSQFETGNIRRQIIYTASLYELDKYPSSLSFKVNEISINELPLVLWFFSKYSNLLNVSETELLNLLSEFKDQIFLEPGASFSEENYYAPNAVDLAMLFTAVSHFAGNFDANTLYKNYPLHPKIRVSSESLFLMGEYVNAVFEASKSFIDEVKQKAGYPVDVNGKNLDGRSLIQKVFSSQNPILKFTPLSSQSEKDEHEGLKLISEGIAAAIRNPKGHDPKTAFHLSGHEALDQLIIISYLLTRVDSSSK